MYSTIGRLSVPPEHLIKGTLLMVLCSIRSERQFCERLRYDLLFKWFLRLTITEAVQQVRALIRVALSRPEDLGLPFTQWSVSKLRAYCLEKELIPPISGEWVRCLLR